MAWRRRRQAMAKWRLRRSQWRWTRGPFRDPDLWGNPRDPDLRHWLRPQRHLAMAWRRRRQAMAK